MNKSVFFSLLLLGLSLFYFVATVLKNPHIFKQYNPQEAYKRFSLSQWNKSQNISPIQVLDSWAIKNGYTGWNNYVDENKHIRNVERDKKNIIDEIRSREISDAELYTYIGYMSAKKHDISLNREHPPLAKYLIGLSIVCCNTAGVVLIMTSVIILGLTYVLIYALSHSCFRSALGILIILIQGSLFDQLLHGPQLDIFHLMFLLLYMFFLMQYLKKQAKALLILAGLMLGFFLSTKSLVTYGVLISVWMGIYIFMIRRKIKSIPVLISIGSFATLAGYILSYVPFFIHGLPFLAFMKAQRYALLFYLDSKIPIIPFIGNYIRLIFTGKLKFWSEGFPVALYKDWNLLWPLILITGVYMIIYDIRKRKLQDKNRLILITYIIVLSLFYLFIPFYPRYLLLLYIPLIIYIVSYTSMLKTK
ncbi:MAG: glycosyltransferase family 39 protein [Patescibacteria group bacterium]